MRLALLLSVLAFLPSAAVAQPRSSAPRIAGEVLAGGAGAILGGIAFGVAGSHVGPQEGEDPGLVGAVFGAMIGIPVGASVGVHLAGRLDRAPVRYWEALGGSLLGMGAMIVLEPALRLDPDQAPFWFAVLGAPVAGAILMQESGIARRLRLSVFPSGRGLTLAARVSF